MYSVLIVDDEINAVLDIELMLKNSKFKFDTIYKARSGEEAKQILLDNSIKLVLSDINMPGLDGIRLLEYIKTQRSDIHVVFITGYAEFEYVRQAIQFGAEGFLLKPIKKEEFEECIGKIYVDSDDRQEQKSDDFEKLGNTVRNMLAGSKCTKDEVVYISDMCKLSEKTNVTLAMISYVKNDKSGGFEYFGRVRRCLEQYNQKEKCRIYTFKGYENDEIMCLCITGDETMNIRHIFDKLYDTLGDGKEQIYISISDTHKEITRELYQHCVEMCFERILWPDEHIFSYKKNDKSGFNIIVEKVKGMETSIIAGKTADVERNISEILNPKNLKTMNMTFRAVYYIIVNSIILTINKLFGTVDASITNELLSDRNLKRFDNVESIIKYLYSMILTNCIKSEDGEKNINNLVEFVNTNYEEELTLKDVGKRFGIAPNYLSRLFKLKTGVTFIRYLNNLRVEKACEYLSANDIKVVKVAELVGYKDIQYFHRVFKKIMGMTPIEYRMKQRREK